MFFTVEFNVKYKGKIKDLLKYKIKNAFFFLFLSIALIFSGAYIAFFGYGRVITWFDSLLGYIFMIGGILTFVSVSFLLVFQAYNRGLKGKIRIDFEKNEDIWKYTLYSEKKKQSFKEEGTVQLVQKDKIFFTISSDKVKDYLIPLKAINEEEQKNLLNLVEEFKIKNKQNSTKNK